MPPCRAYMIVPGSGPLVILTTYQSITDSELLEKLDSKGINKFIAFEVPLGLVKERYGRHYDVVVKNLYETDDLRVLDFDGPRAFRSFSFKEMGAPIYYEANAA